MAYSTIEAYRLKDQAVKLALETNKNVYVVYDEIRREIQMQTEVSDSKQVLIYEIDPEVLRFCGFGKK